MIQLLLDKVNTDYDYMADKFSAARQYVWGDLKVLADYIKDDDKVLDWGCGNGRFFGLLQDRKVNYLGIDNCKRLIEIAQEKYPEADWQVSSDVPFQSFDVIIAIAAWHHLPSRKLRKEKLIEFFDGLNQGGYLLLTSWNLKQKKYFGLWLKNNLRNLFTGYEWNDVLVPWKADEENIYRYVHHQSKRSMIRLLHQVGFEVVTCYYSDDQQRSNWWQGKNLIAIARKP